MGYRIVYGQEVCGSDAKQKRRPWIYICVLLAVVSVIHLTGIGEHLRQWLLPGDSAVTEAALEGLADRLMQGQNFREAVTVFCKEIIRGSGIQ